MKRRPMMIDMDSLDPVSDAVKRMLRKHVNQMNHHAVWNAGGAWCYDCSWRWTPDPDLFDLFD